MCGLWNLSGVRSRERSNYEQQFRIYDKHLKNCKFASVVKYQYSDDKKGWYIQFGNVLHGIKYCPYCGMRLEDENGR